MIWTSAACHQPSSVTFSSHPVQKKRSTQGGGIERPNQRGDQLCQVGLRTAPVIFSSLTVQIQRISREISVEWRRGQGNVECRSQLAGEDMPRKCLDAIGTNDAMGWSVGKFLPYIPAQQRAWGLGQSPRKLLCVYHSRHFYPADGSRNNEGRSRFSLEANS